MIVMKKKGREISLFLMILCPLSFRMHLRLSSVFHSNAERWWGTRTNTNTHMHNTVSLTFSGLDAAKLL